MAPLCLLCGIYWMPESPRFLALVNRNDEAWEVIKKIHHDPSDPADAGARAEYTQIIKQVEFDKEIDGSYIAMFTRPSWRKRSLLAFFLMFATQSTGCLGITTFQVIIYQYLGLVNSMPLLRYGVYVSVAAIFNYSGAALVDKIGRRRQLRKSSELMFKPSCYVLILANAVKIVIGYPLIAIVLLIGAILQKTYVGTDNKSGNATCVAFIFLFIAV